MLCGLLTILRVPEMVDFVLVEHDQLVVKVWSLILPGGEYRLLGNRRLVLLSVCIVVEW